MDYKSFTVEFDIIKNKLLSFINQKNKANSERAITIVDDYLKEISEGSYSLKSYKAKIIHNELEHTKTKKEFNVLKEEIINSTKDLFNLYFEEYLNEVKNEITSPTKEKDIKDYNNSKRRARLDVVNKKNALERDTADKIKELDTNLAQLRKDFHDKSNDFRTKLQGDINKLTESTIKEYSSYEKDLVDINEKNQVKEIKEKIKEIRLKGLKEEYELKLKSYDLLYNDKNSYIIDINNLEYEKEKCLKEKEMKLIEYESTLKKIDIQLENHEHNYDAITESENINNCYKEIDELIQLIKLSNEYIISFNNRDNTDLILADKIFIFDFAVLNLDYLLVFVRKNNVYDSLAKILIDIIAIIHKLKESTINLIMNEKQIHKEKRDALYEVLKDYDPNSRKVTKEEYLENVLTSLDRYYENYFNEVFFFNMEFFSYITLINDIIRDNLNKLIPLENNYRMLPSNFMEESTKYDYINLNDYFGEKLVPSDLVDKEYTKNELLESFASSLKVTYQERKEKITKIMEMLESDYNKNLSDLDDSTKAEIKKKEDELKEIFNKYENNKVIEASELEKSISSLKTNALVEFNKDVKYL